MIDSFLVCLTKMVLLGRVGHMSQFTLYQTPQNCQR